MLEILSNHCGIKVREFGYAGLKDKEALTYQYISINKMYESKLEDFEHESIKILEKTYHNNKIKRGHLKGNRFFIRLKKVMPMAATKIDQALQAITNEGLPNFFGFQRFGRDKTNHIQGQEILEGKRKIRSKNLRELLINAYQSYLFNAWLSERIDFSHLVNNFNANELQAHHKIWESDVYKTLKSQTQFFKLLEGDVISHYPHGRLFNVEDESAEAARFANKDITPTGLLSGTKVKASTSRAFEIEKKYQYDIALYGDRRFAWIFPEIELFEYKEEKAQAEITFTLPKGAYATNLIEELCKRPLV
jgi:tRNA pseudouridine13 synthase